MKDNKLAEIEGRAAHWEVMGTVEVDGDTEEGPVGIAVTLRETDYDWLIARVRQLQEYVELVEDAGASQCAVLDARIRELEAELAALLKLEALHRGVERKRIAALEAQAARDATIINAAAGVDANAVLDNDFDESEHVYYTVPKHIMWALRAALAAREVTHGD